MDKPPDGPPPPGAPAEAPESTEPGTSPPPAATDSAAGNPRADAGADPTADSTADSTANAAADAGTEAAPADGAEPESLATRLQAAKAAALAGEPGAAAVAPPLEAGAPHPAAALPWWRRWWPFGAQAGSGTPAARPAAPGAKPQPLQPAEARPTDLKPLFSQKFLWPLSPGQVARWARRHAALSPMAPAAWPVRKLAAEPALQQQARTKGQRHTLQLHMATAAIGVGDRRIRVLIGADGQVLGPRAMDRRKVAVVAGVGLLMATVVASQWPHKQPAEAETEVLAAASAASGPTATDQAHGAAVVADAGASASDSAAASAPLAAASAAEGSHGQGDGHAHGDSTAAASAATAAAEAASGPDQHADAHGPGPATSAAASAPQDRVAKAPAPLTVTTTPPPKFPERRASGPLARIRPQLSGEDRLLARQQSEAARAMARGETPAATAAANPGQNADAPATTAASTNPSPAASPAGAGRASPVAANLRFAVVTFGTAQREPAEAYLAQLMSVRAQMPSPGTARTELVQQQGQWHAALWPFATVGDAERARTMLATRGLKTEVVAF